MPDQYQRDRQALERLRAELTRRQVATELVIPNSGRPFPALNIYQPGHTYAVDSVWSYQPGERLPGAHSTAQPGLVARIALIPSTPGDPTSSTSTTPARSSAPPSGSPPPTRRRPTDPDGRPGATRPLPAFASPGGPVMHPQDYPCSTYAVLLSSGRWAVVCEHCQTTLAITISVALADAVIAAHPCTTIVPTSGEMAR